MWFSKWKEVNDHHNSNGSDQGHFSSNQRKNIDTTVKLTRVAKATASANMR